MSLNTQPVDGDGQQSFTLELSGLDDRNAHHRSPIDGDTGVWGLATVAGHETPLLGLNRGKESRYGMFHFVHTVPLL